MSVRLCLVVLLMGLLPACIGRSPDTHFYVLSSPGAVMATGETPVTGPRVAVGPVTLPGYLDRPEMFVRKGATVDVQIAEYHHWGEPLGEGMVRVLCDTLSARLAQDHGLAFPLRATMNADWRISVDIARFDGAPDSEVLLDAGWTLSDSQGDTVRQGRFVDRLTAGAALGDLADTQGQLLSRFSAVLANAVEKAESAKKKR